MHRPISEQPRSCVRVVTRFVAVPAFWLAMAFAIPTPAIEVSPDIALSLGGTTVFDEEGVADLSGTTTLLLPVGVVPPHADMVGFEDVGGDFLLSFDTTVSLAAGGITAERRDVVRWDGSVFALEFDGSGSGVPNGAGIDAIGIASGAQLLLSFDVAVDLPGIGFVQDEGVVAYSGGTFTTLFDGSALGNAALSLDTDAVSHLGTGTLLLSFDRSGTVGGVTFDDEDVLRYVPGTGVWSLEYDGSAAHAAWAAGDLVAVPEPGSIGLAIGSLVTALLGLRRRPNARMAKTILNNGESMQFSRNRRVEATILLIGLTWIVAPLAMAVDGLLEINHTFVLSSGGYPYTVPTGSYVLTGNLTPPPNTTALLVASNDVTIDLNGFTIDGGSGGCTSVGVSISCPLGSGLAVDAPTRERVRVHSGFVTDFAGTCLRLGDSSRVEHVSVSGCSTNGIEVGANALVRENIVTTNGGAGILGGVEIHVVDNISYGNGAAGIEATRSARIERNVSETNAGIGISTNNQASIRNNVAAANEAGAIKTLNRSQIVSNVAVSTQVGPGIIGQDDVTIRWNLAKSNGLADPQHGIECNFRCSIEGNAANLNSNDGIHVGGTGSVAYNTSSQNGADGIHCDSLSANSCSVTGNFSSDNILGFGLRISAAGAVVGTYKKNLFLGNGAGSVNRVGLDPGGTQNSCAGVVPCP